MSLGQQRCSIVVVTSAGRTEDPGCGAGERGSLGLTGKQWLAQAEPLAWQAYFLTKPIF